MAFVDPVAGGQLGQCGWRQINEVGSIHTIQGYDLNYAGVIIGPDLRYDSTAGKLHFARDSYFDTKGKQNNAMLGATYSDDDLLTYVTNIYRVLLTRGIRGTYVYVCDPGLSTYLENFIPPAESTISAERPSGSVPDMIFAQDDGTSIDGDTFQIELGAQISEVDSTANSESS